MADIHLEKQICNLQAQLSTAHAKISLLETEHKQTAQTPLRAISGNEMLHSLKLSAREGLSTDEFKYFGNFLEMLETHRAVGNPYLQTSVSKLLDDFYTAETTISQRSRAGLVRPGGVPFATIGLVMHCPSQNRSCQSFFDRQNPSVRLLMDKGFTEENTYGFDWHWRAEAHQKHRRCPIREYSTNLKSHHEVMTRTMLNLLPLPLLIVTGSCPWNNYLSTLSASARHIKVLIAKGVVATFALDFRLRGLKRITCHIPHPESLFYHKTLQWEQDAMALALRTDSSLNLFLELAGHKIPSRDNYFLSSVSKNPRYRPKMLADIKSFRPDTSSKTDLIQQQSKQVCKEPIMECHGYVRKEKDLNVRLDISQYNQSFINWARATYGVVAEEVLEKGESFAFTVKWIMVEKVEAINKARLQVAASIKARLREGAIEREQNLQPQQPDGNPQLRKISKRGVDDAGTQDSLPAAKRQRTTAKNRPRLKGKIQHDFWHSSVVKLPPNGDIYFAVPSEETCLRIRTSARLGKRLKVQGYNYNDIEKGKVVTIWFTEDGIKIRYGTEIVWQKSVAGLENVSDGKRLKEQWARELNALTMTEKSHIIKKSTGQTLDPIPGGPATEFTAHNQRNSGRHGKEIREFWHGQVMKIGAHGDMRIQIPERQRALKFRLGKSLGGKLQNTTSAKTLHFDNGGVKIKDGPLVIWSKSRASLKALKGGDDWVTQLDKELEEQKAAMLLGSGNRTGIELYSPILDATT